MDLSKKLNSEKLFTDIFEKITLTPTLKNAVQILDFQHPTFCQEKLLEKICPNEELAQKQEKKLNKKLKKLQKKAEESEEESEEEEEEEEEIEEEEEENSEEESGDEEEEKKEETKEDKEEKLKQKAEEKQQKKAQKKKQQQSEISELEKEIENKDYKQYILKSSYQSGKTVAVLVSQINDFIQKVENFDPKKLQKDQDEATHGLFSVLLCQSKEHCQKGTTLAENLLLKFKKKDKQKLGDNTELIELSQKEKNINSGILVYNLSTLDKEQKPSIMPNKHYILVATPSQFLHFAKTMKIEQQFYVNFSIDDLDYMISFGYEQELDNFYFHFKNELQTNQIVISMSSQDNQDEFSDILSKLAPKRKIIDANFELEMDEEENEEELKKTMQVFERDYRIVSQFYHIGDEITKYIILYILYKLRFLAGKSIIVCPDLESVYKTSLFMQRIGVEKNFQVYNEEDPKNLRYYLLSLLNTGVISTIICTEKVFEDLKNKTFYGKKRKILSFKNLSNIILFDLQNVKDQYNDLYKYFRGSEGTMVSLVDSKEDQIETLTKIIQDQKQTFSKINIKEFPLKKHEIDAFKYRISDTITAISRKQVQNSRMLDFKKKLLKSKDLSEYFTQNTSERQMLIEDIQSLSQQLHRYGIKCEDDIPEYLVPDLVKEQRKKFSDQQGKDKQRFTKLQVARSNDNFQKSLKRRMESNNLKLEDVKKKKLFDKTNDQYIYINNEKEKVEGDQVDANQLKVISGRKLWKQKHGFKLRTRNRRMEKKGIFNA